MAKKGRKRAADAGAPPEAAAGPSQRAEEMTELEYERAAIIARNRERLLALGIPSLVKELQAQAGAAAAAAKPKKKAKVKVKQEEGLPRGRQAAAAEERFERELGQMVVDETCPRCGKAVSRGHRTHLMGCGGERPPRQPRPSDREELAELTEEERRDAFKRTLARMKKLNLDGLTELNSEVANQTQPSPALSMLFCPCPCCYSFAVLGSTGNHYSVKLADDKHTCTCLDYRFRRHHCKHICLVLSNLGILEAPAGWRTAVNSRMDELVAQARQRQEREAAAEAPLRSQAETVGLKFI
ncbi:hypothetical protein COHA_002115 [Chlorella ohadii]|uniref:SWIM-type domain-containing protein n=1 Tax=Chlorella ohadii TaxID=2649997 RepID=A0AAD5DVA3_9CHLO|nr:hypothetical protein COHA_002115 [Chlorella ohadii]